MIGCFPDPYPDELLYSVCARFHDRVRYPNKKSTIQELFGAAAAIAIVDLPSNLEHLIAALPPGTLYHLEQLIQQNTLFPLFAPFLDSQQAQLLRADMAGSHGSAIQMRSGLMASTISAPEYLRFCPVCVLKDRQQWGETYWHRVHHVPGLNICAVHNVWLLNSKVRIQNPRTRHEYVSAERNVELPQSDSYKLQRPYQNLLWKLAQDVQWLLKAGLTPPGLDILVKHYRQMLATQDLATFSGRVRVSQLLPRFCQYYSADFLKQVQCEIDINSQHNWLFRLVRSPKSSQYPLRHLLLMQFLGCSAESFFQRPLQVKPFGENPWPCLNPAACHYGQAVISQCTVHYSRENGKPIGTFTCSCGFRYLRTGPDKSPEDRLRITKILAFGATWEGALKQLWQDPEVSLRGIARQLRVDPNTVKLHAAALGLEFPRQGARLTNRSTRSLSTQLPVKQRPNWKQRKQYRGQWIEIRKNHPELRRTALKQEFSRVYTWLWRHDRVWMETHLPPPITKPFVTPRVDWLQRDLELVEAVKQAAQQLRQCSGKPTKITLTAISRELGQVALIQQHLDKLPQTAATLKGLVESREAFALRRIIWAAECYLVEGICPQPWQLARRAGIKSDLKALPSIQDALKTAIEQLKVAPLKDANTYSAQRLAI